MNVNIFETEKIAENSPYIFSKLKNRNIVTVIINPKSNWVHAFEAALTVIYP